jgi:hypothetical protein
VQEQHLAQFVFTRPGWLVHAMKLLVRHNLGSGPPFTKLEEATCCSNDTATCPRRGTPFTGKFGFYPARHHCRACGCTFCDTCSSATFNMPEAGAAEVRVCSGCRDGLEKCTNERGGVATPEQVRAAVERLRHQGVLELWLLPRLWQTLRLNDSHDGAEQLGDEAAAAAMPAPAPAAASSDAGSGCGAQAAEVVPQAAGIAAAVADARAAPTSQELARLRGDLASGQLFGALVEALVKCNVMHPIADGVEGATDGPRLGAFFVPQLLNGGDPKTRTFWQSLVRQMVPEPTPILWPADKPADRSSGRPVSKVYLKEGLRSRILVSFTSRLYSQTRT